MKSIKEKAEEYSFIEEGIDLKGVPYKDYNNDKMGGFEAGANYVLNEIEKELKRRMLEDYNQGAEEDEIAHGCMASMIMFVRQLKSNQ